ncbi:MAG: hypothetical protein FWC87_00210 [Acidimicrobiaceae bacterium]|nr:hypothetical protein [Acidimicrobiaceae bacterium]
MFDTFLFRAHAHRLTGGFPGNPRLIDAWLASNKAPADAADQAAQQLAIRQEFNPEDTHTTIFWRAPDGSPEYESRAMKAAIKEAANILGSTASRSGVLDVKNFRSKLAERVFVDPRIGGCPIICGCGETHQPGDILHLTERPIQVMTMQGPRTSLKAVEYATDVPLQFNIRILRDGIVKETHLRTILEYLQDGGLGADRSQGSGTFDLIDFEQIA